MWAQNYHCGPTEVDIRSRFNSARYPVLSLTVVAIGYGMGCRGIMLRFSAGERDFSALQKSLPGIKQPGVGRGEAWCSTLNILSRLRMSGAVTPLSIPHMPSWRTHNFSSKILKFSVNPTLSYPQGTILRVKWYISWDDTTKYMPDSKRIYVIYIIKQSHYGPGQDRSLRLPDFKTIDTRRW